MLIRPELQLPQKIEEGLTGLIPCEVASFGYRTLTEFGLIHLVTEDTFDRLQHFVRTIGVNQDARFTDDFRQSGRMRCDHRNTTGERLEWRKTEAFIERWVDEEARQIVQGWFIEIVDKADETDFVPDG